MPHICVSELGKHCFRQWLVACSAPSHYLNQWWLIVNWTLRNKLKWNSNQNTKLFINENTFENVAREMVVIVSKGWWVNHDILSVYILYLLIYTTLSRRLSLWAFMVQLNYKCYAHVIFVMWNSIAFCKPHACSLYDKTGKQTQLKCIISHPWLLWSGTRFTIGKHYNDVIMSGMASQITGVSIVCSTILSGVNQRKQHSSASLTKG